MCEVCTAWLYKSRSHFQGVITPIGTVFTAKTGVKKWSTSQGVFLSLVKQSKTIFVTGYCSQTVKSLFADVNFGMVKG